MKSLAYGSIEPAPFLERASLEKAKVVFEHARGTIYVHSAILSATRFDAAVWSWGRAWRIPDSNGRVLSGWVGLLVDPEGIEHAFGGHRIVGSFNQTIAEWPAIEKGALGSPDSGLGVQRICERQKATLVDALARSLE